MDKALVRAFDAALEHWHSREYFEPKELTAWASLHGWEISTLEDRKLILRQAALDVLLQELIPELRSHRFSTPLEQPRVELPSAIIESVRLSWREYNGFNYWGDLHNLLIPQAKRRQLGQFWTDENLADLMTRWLLESKPRQLIDVGCGAGNFLLSSLDVSPQTVRCGIDISPLLLNVALAAHYTRAHTRADVPTLRQADFLDEKVLEHSDAVICNPPYTRHHDIAPQRKDQLQNLLKSRFRMEIPRQGTLAFYFLLKLIAELMPRARAAVIVPMQVLDARYGKVAKRILASHTRLIAMIHFSPQLNAFHQVDVGAAILFFEKGYTRDNTFRHLTLKRIPKSQVVLDLIQSKTQGENEFGVVATRAQDELLDVPKWFSFTASPPAQSVSQNGLVVPLKTLARVVRGIATGANDFFTLTDIQVAELQLQDYVVCTIHRNREIQDLCLDEDQWQQLAKAGKRVWLLYLDNENSSEHPALARYLAQGEKLGYPARSLVQTRRIWYAMEKREIPPIFFTILTRGNPRFIRNRAGVRPLNMFSLLYPNAAVLRAKAVDEFWALLNSHFSLSRLHSVSRTYGGNTLKVEPRELDNLPVINPLALADELRTAIRQTVQAFYCHHDTKLFQREIDEIVTSALSQPSTTPKQEEFTLQLQLLEAQETYSPGTDGKPIVSGKTSQ